MNSATSSVNLTASHAGAGCKEKQPECYNVKWINTSFDN